MFKKFVFTIMTVFFAANIASGQGDEIARLRVVQLSYISEGSAIVDIQLNDDVVFEGVSFPFMTDYVELTAGDHRLMTSISDQAGASASTPLMLESGHSYSLIVAGDYQETVTFILIDENNAPLPETGSAAILINLTGQTINDIALNDEILVDSIVAGDFSTINLPITEFTLSGGVGSQKYSETFTPHSHTLFLVVVRLLPSGDAQVIYQRSSPLTIADYLQSVDEGAQFSQIAELIGMTNLLESITDEGEYTLFLPINNALEGEIPTDADQLHDLLSRHIIVQTLPPYLLPNHESLMTRAGDNVLLNFGGTASGYWEIEGAPILWDVHLANGVIYAIDGIID